MRTLVCFRTGHGAYAVPVGSAVSVRPATGLVPMPGARPGVAGVLPGDPPLTVLAALGEGRRQVLVVRGADQDYGLLVEEVTGLRRVSPEDIRPAPAGQELDLFTGVLQGDDELVLIADPAVLAALAVAR